MTDYNPEKTVIIVGYPRSGNTWLTRLVAEALDSPAARFGDALPLSVEGKDRPGDWLVSQLHLKVRHKGPEGDAIRDAWEFNVDAWRGEKILLVFRDPRDVAISAKHYWDLDSHRTALLAMINGTPPFASVGKWVEFYIPWLELARFSSGIVLPVSYEGVYLFPATYLGSIIEAFGLELSRRKIEETVINQQFDNKKNEIANEFTDGTRNARPYGKTIQLKAMHKGTAFQYRTEMSEEDSSFACMSFEEVMLWMGYQAY